MRFWNFVTNEAAPESDVELRISGDIVDDEDAWLYEWFGLQCISPNAFKNELTQYASKNISVWIDSYGGNVFAAAGIYNALMEHKKSGAKVTTIGDSKIMSAATTIFMAGDARKMSPGCIFMMHNPLTSAAGYASELRKAADVLDVVKDCIINAYQLATGLSRNKISSMMDDETYMSARTAIKNGFATEMLYAQENQDNTPEPAVNFSFNRLAIQNAANDSMKKFFELAQEVKNGSKSKGGTMVDIKTADDLRNAFPELVNQIVTAAVQNTVKKEQERMKNLDALNDPQNAAVCEIISDAKNSGKTAEEVKAIVDIVKKHSKTETSPDNEAGKDFMSKLVADNKNSGVDGAKAAGTGAGNGDERQEAAAAVNFMSGFINKKNGREQK